MATPAKRRFLSVEPMVRHPKHGHVRLRNAQGRLHWVIAGGESGQNREELDIAALRDLAADCYDAGIAMHVKQDSGMLPGGQGRIPDWLYRRKQFPVGQGWWQSAVYL